jgi:diguanylate cyclase (GGDEF)-like protein
MEAAMRGTELAGCRVVAVADDTALADLRERLQAVGIQLIAPRDGERFREVVEAAHPDVVLLDAHTRDHSGLELCRELRAHERWVGTPVMLLGDASDPEAVNLAHAAGADDYISRPIASAQLVARIASRLERHRRVQETAGFDPLTGLLTRRHCEDALQTLIRLAARYHRPFSLAVINIDGLRAINETCGHATGDAVLRRLAHLLRTCFRLEDVVARMGGDQFLLGAWGMEKDDCVRRLRMAAAQFREQPFTSGDLELHVTFSAGVSALFSDGPGLPEVVQAAADTLTFARSMGRACVVPAGWMPGRQAPVDVVDVVIIEPDAPLAALLLHALEQTGWSTRGYADGEEAVGALCGACPQVRARALLLEADLPGRDGFHVLRTLGRNDVLARSRVIMLTGPAHEREVQKAFELGAADHVAKPFSVQILLQRIRRAIQG